LREDDPVEDDTIVDPAVRKDILPIIDRGYKLSSPLNAIREYQTELESLSTLNDKQEKQRRYSECPRTMQFAFLLSSLSRPALRLARQFVPLPSESSIWCHYHETLEAIAVNLTDRARIDG
jgi:hypothetical protein